MPDEWAPGPDPYVDDTDPIALSPRAYRRFKRAVDRVLEANRARYPYPRRGRTTGANAGAWGALEPGGTITAASGLVLGQGSVTLCSRSGATLTADGDVVGVLNAGDAITAGGSAKVIKLSWSDGSWAASRCN